MKASIDRLAGSAERGLIRCRNISQAWITGQAANIWEGMQQLHSLYYRENLLLAGALSDGFATSVDLVDHRMFVSRVEPAKRGRNAAIAYFNEYIFGCGPRLSLVPGKGTSSEARRE
ncbi:hypothetical protein [Noviherbaspirillum saxi]|uniref:hypothetical protein n=1 Tax=Noviherbaspirillum saxi TaxID=2320863 RepID=UPI001314B001|nr:hypothetical protein [Noviherbaspirillum saxi]